MSSFLTKLIYLRSNQFADMAFASDIDDLFSYRETDNFSPFYLLLNQFRSANNSVKKDFATRYLQQLVLDEPHLLKKALQEVRPLVFTGEQGKCPIELDPIDSINGIIAVAIIRRPGAQDRFAINYFKNLNVLLRLEVRNGYLRCPMTEGEIVKVVPMALLQDQHLRTLTTAGGSDLINLNDIDMDGTEEIASLKKKLTLPHGIAGLNVSYMPLLQCVREAAMPTELLVGESLVSMLANTGNVTRDFIAIKTNLLNLITDSSSCNIANVLAITKALEIFGCHANVIAATERFVGVIEDPITKASLLYHKGIAHFMIQEFDAAISCFDDALAIEDFGRETSLVRTSYCYKGRAYSHLGQGYEQNAIDSFDRALTTEAAELPVVERLGILMTKARHLRTLNNLGAAIHCLDEALELPSPDEDTKIDALWSKGQNLYDLTLYDDAIAIFTDVIELCNASEISRNNLLAKVIAQKALSLKAIGNHAEALVCFRESIGISNAHLSDGDRAKIIYGEGETQFLLGNYAIAIDVFNELIEIYPAVWQGEDLANTLVLKGRSLLRLDEVAKMPEAIDVFTRALDLDVSPDDRANILFSKVKALYKLHNYADALVAVNESLALEQLSLADTRQAMIWRVNYLLELKKYPEALQYIDELLEEDWLADKLKARLFHSKGVSLIELKRFEESLEYLDLALSIQDWDFVDGTLFSKAYAQSALGEKFNTTKNYDIAEDILQKALAIDVLKENDLAFALEHLGLALTKLSRYNEAIACLDKVIAMADCCDADYKDRASRIRVEALSGLGLKHILSGEFTEALTVFTELATVEPTNIKFLENKAIALYELGDFDEADKMFSTVISLYGEEGVREQEKALALHYKSLVVKARLVEGSDSMLYTATYSAACQADSTLCKFRDFRSEDLPKSKAERELDELVASFDGIGRPSMPL